MTRIRFYGSGLAPNLSRAKRPPGERGDTRPTDARVKGAGVILLPLREKVASEGRRMRGRAALSAKTLRG